MLMLPNEIVVLDIAGTEAQVLCADPDLAIRLQSLGFSHDGSRYMLPIQNHQARHQLVEALIALRALFSFGHGRSPAELVDDLLGQGAIATGFRMIAWKGPDHFVISDR